MVRHMKRKRPRFNTSVFSSSIGENGVTAQAPVG